MIKSVYRFQNGMVMAFDEYGRQLPEYQGKAEDVIPLIRAAGYTEEIETFEWQRRGD